MHGLVREHRVADNVPDGEYVRHIGALLVIHWNETALIHDEPCGVRIYSRPLGLRPTASNTRSYSLRFGCLYPRRKSPSTRSIAASILVTLFSGK